MTDSRICHAWVVASVVCFILSGALGIGDLFQRGIIGFYCCQFGLADCY